MFSHVAMFPYIFGILVKRTLEFGYASNKETRRKKKKWKKLLAMELTSR